MLESPPPPARVIAIAAVLGIALAALCGFGGALAAVGGWLAQPAFALALRGSQQRTQAGTATGGAMRSRWRCCGAWPHWRSAALVAWPLHGVAARRRRSAPRSALSLVAGLVLIVLWRQWPLWHGLERDGGSLAERWQALDWFDVDAWRGLGVAALVSAIAGDRCCCSRGRACWRRNSAGCWRRLCALAWPALHWGLQRIAPADRAGDARGPGRRCGRTPTPAPTPALDEQHRGRAVRRRAQRPRRSRAGAARSRRRRACAAGRRRARPAQPARCSPRCCRTCACCAR